MSEPEPSAPSFGYWHDQACEKGFAGAESKVEAACGCESRLVRKLQRDNRRMASAVRMASSLLLRHDRRNAAMLEGLAREATAPEPERKGGATQVLARDEASDRGFMTFVELTDAYGAWVALREASADPLDKAWVFVQGGELQHNDGAILLDADGLRELRDAADRAIKHLSGGG